VGALVRAEDGLSATQPPRRQTGSEISIRLKSHVDRADAPRGAGAQHRAFDDGPALRVQPLDHRVERDAGDEAEVQRTGHRQVRLGLELGALHVQVDLLQAEAQRVALHRRRAADEGLELHAEHAGVEVHAGLAARGGQHEVVQVVDHGRQRGVARNGRRAA
jgi:hypothetical protein